MIFRIENLKHRTTQRVSERVSPEFTKFRLLLLLCYFSYHSDIKRTGRKKVDIFFQVVSDLHFSRFSTGLFLRFKERIKTISCSSGVAVSVVEWFTLKQRILTMLNCQGTTKKSGFQFLHFTTLLSGCQAVRLAVRYFLLFCSAVSGSLKLSQILTFSGDFTTL